MNAHQGGMSVWIFFEEKQNTTTALQPQQSKSGLTTEVGVLTGDGELTNTTLQRRKSKIEPSSVETDFEVAKLCVAFCPVSLS